MSSIPNEYVKTVKANYDYFNRVLQIQWMQEMINGQRFLSEKIQTEFERADLNNNLKWFNRNWPIYHKGMMKHMICSFGEFYWKNFRIWLTDYISKIDTTNTNTKYTEPQNTANHLQILVMGKIIFDNADKKGQDNEANGTWGVRTCTDSSSKPKFMKDEISLHDKVSKLRLAWINRPYTFHASSSDDSEELKEEYEVSILIFIFI